MCEPIWEEIHRNKNMTEVRDVMSILNPERVELGNITINIQGNKDERMNTVDDLRGFDNENLRKISPKIESMLQTTGIYNTKGEKIDYGNDSQAMLAADLTLFYTRGLGIVVLHVMVPEPYRFPLCFLK
jgi:hypothetical protein